MNTIRIQQEEIASRVQRLDKAIRLAFGVEGSDTSLEALVSVTKSQS